MGVSVSLTTRAGDAFTVLATGDKDLAQERPVCPFPAADRWHVSASSFTLPSCSGNKDRAPVRQILDLDGYDPKIDRLLIQDFGTACHRVIGFAKSWTGNQISEFGIVLGFVSGPFLV